MEYGFAKERHGPFDTEMAAVRDARTNKAGAFITGRNDDGWFWSLEDHYIQVSENKTVAVNFPEGS